MIAQATSGAGATADAVVVAETVSDAASPRQFL
jgi:hypothetical protein